MQIREARKAKGMTMKELGDRIGTTESVISLYERGLQQPPPSKRHATAHILHGDAFGAEYKVFTREQRKTLWRATLARLEVDKDGNIYIFFR